MTVKSFMLRAILASTAIVFIGCAKDDLSAGGRNVFAVDPTAPKPNNARPDNKRGARFGYQGEERKPNTQPDNAEVKIVKPNNASETTPNAPVIDGLQNPDQGTEENKGVENQTPAPNPRPITPPKPKDYPFAEPVPGSATEVYTPYSPGSRVSVADMKPGTLVKCPITGKLFRVP